MIAYVLAALAALAAAAYAFGVGASGNPTRPTGSLPGEKPESVPSEVWQWRTPVLQLYQKEDPRPLQPADVMAVIWQESGGDDRALGAIGEQGLTQMTQAALDDARMYDDEMLPTDVKKLTARQNIRAMMRYAALNARRLAQYGDPITARNVIRQHNGGPTGHRKEATVKYADEVQAKAAQFA